MDCTDIVIGTARGEMSRVWDYYTRDRSTPRLDTFWGGKSDLTATGGFEKDGITTIIFRKKLSADEPTDHSFTDEIMHVIWAKGQVSLLTDLVRMEILISCHRLGHQQGHPPSAVWFGEGDEFESRILQS